MFITFTFVVFLAWNMLEANINGKIIKDEIKAYFRPTVHIDYKPSDNQIKTIEIGGTPSMKICDLYKEDGTAVYNTNQHIERITKYINSLILVQATDDELPNMSPDTVIKYLDDKGEAVQTFIIFGQIFIKDCNNDKLYRVKSSAKGIVNELEEFMK